MMPDIPIYEHLTFERHWSRDLSKNLQQEVLEYQEVDGTQGA
jgi:hypothetical protein